MIRILNKRILLGAGALILITIYFNWRNIQIKWVEVFKQDATFFNYNSQGIADGKVICYSGGKIYAVGNIVNGIKQGWETMFYDNGKIKSRTYFVDGQATGKVYLYNSDGGLSSSGYFMNGKPYGSWYGYDKNGHINKYVLVDIDEDKSFTLGYEVDGRLKLKDMDGLVVSPNFYSVDSKNNAIIPLSYEKKTDRKFSNINDLYITVANPEHTRLSVTVKINKNQYQFYRIKSNTIKIPNAFLEKGKYDIFVESHLYDADNKSINGINIVYKLFKE